MMNNTDAQNNSIDVSVKHKAHSIFGKDTMCSVTAQWLNNNKQAGLLTELEFQFGHFLLATEPTTGNVQTDSAQQPPIHAGLIVLIGVVTVQQLANQSTCIRLKQILNTRLIDVDQLLLPESSEWQSHIARSTCFSTDAPLTYFDGLVFLSRNYLHEVNIAQYVARQCALSPAHGWLKNIEDYQERVGNLFAGRALDPSSLTTFDWQHHAVMNSVQHRFSVITGGPGTGKTTTVIKLLAALIANYHQLAGFLVKEKGPLKIALAAPTGKAALRLTESLLSGIERLDLPVEIKDALPKEATTLHRLLKPRGSGFYYNLTNTLPLDVLILDEASMVDLSLMSQLVNALAPETQVVMLGDEQQLASVEAGNVLAEICKPLAQLSNKQQTATMFITKLKKSYRFDSNGAIGQLATNVIAGEGPAVVDQLKQSLLTTADAHKLDDTSEIPWHTREKSQAVAMISSRTYDIEQLVNVITPHFVSLVKNALTITSENEEQTVRGLFNQLFEFQVLACVRNGHHGVEGINQSVTARLTKQGYRQGGTEGFIGRPILITENAYHLGLFNGDIGIQGRDPVSGGLVSYFIDADNNIKKIFNQRLPHHDSVFAMTVHKSQGSEFDHTLLVLPQEDSGSGLLTRELLYTAITRAKHQFTMFGSAPVVTKMVGTKTARLSGIQTLIEYSKKGQQGCWPVQD